MGADSFAKLNSINYATWSLRMQALLIKKELWDVVAPVMAAEQGDVNVPTSSAAAAAAAADPARSAKALAVIMLNVEDEHLLSIRNAGTARAAWQLLTNTFRAKTNARLLVLRKDLNCLQKESSESLSQYAARARSVSADLAEMGAPVEARDLASAYLNGLPQTFDNIVEVLTNSMVQLDLDAVLPKLLETEQRILRRDASSSTALAASKPPRTGQVHSPSNPLARFRNVRCHKCNRLGHIARYCKQARQSGGNNSRDDDSNGNSKPWEKQGFNRGSRLALTHSVVAGVHLADAWLLDSGAMEHLTFDMSLLSDYRALPKAIEIRFGNGSIGYGIGYGAINVKATPGSSYEEITLTRVLYVPEARYHIISVKKLSDNGADVNIKARDGADIIYNEVKVLTASRHSSGYVIPVVRDSAGDLVLAAPATVAKEKETPELWHARYGHLSFGSIGKLVMNDLVKGIDVDPAAFDAIAKELCSTCVTSKSTRLPFPTSETLKTESLELIHMDLCGPIATPSIGGSHYMATFLDDFTKYSVVCFTRYKSDLPDIITDVLNYVEKQTGHQVKAVRTDRGSEYLNEATAKYFGAKGIAHQKTATYTPQQNGAAERLNRTIMEQVRAMLQESNLPDNLWAEAANTACYLRNMAPVSGIDRTPFELFWGQVPKVSHLRIFGCEAFIQVPKELRSKLEPTSRRGKFVGYELDSKAYRVLVDNKIKISRDVIFNERPSVINKMGKINKTPKSKAHRSTDRKSKFSDSDSDSSDSDDDDNQPRLNAGDDIAMLDPSAPNVRARDDPDNDRRYPKRSNQGQQREWYKASTPLIVNAAVMNTKSDYESDYEPKTAKEALSPELEPLWRPAMDEEMTSLMSNNTWELTELPTGFKTLQPKWVYKVKHNSDGTLERRKARLVVKGFMQEEGIDYFDVFAPTSKHTTLRSLLAMAAHDDLYIEHLDVKTAFLNGELEEEIYMEQPEGYVNNPNLVCRLRKALYGLKQAPRTWFLKLKTELDSLGFYSSSADPSLYIKESNGEYIYLLVFVDDILIFAKDKTPIQEVKDGIKSCFDIRDLGEVTRFIGIQVERDYKSKTIKINQSSMITELLDKYNMSDAHPKTVPMSPSTKLVKTDDNQLDVSKVPYRELVGSLLYLSICTRPDISYAVGALARHMANPSSEHWTAAKGVLRYLAGTVDIGIIYGDPGNINKEFSGYCDADYAGDLSTRRSTTGFVFKLNGGIISWSSKLQPTVALSTTEAEYMAAAGAIKEALWLRTLFKELGMNIGTVNIFADNQSAIKLLKNPVVSNRSKHIDVLYHFAREHVMLGDIKLDYVSTNNMMADIFTKALPEVKFIKHVRGMGMR